MPALSHVAEQVRDFDRDRYLTALLAQPQDCEHLFALYAFNAEVARIPERVTEPMIGRIRLQWWRDALDGLYAGASPPHPVALALEQTVRAKHLERSPFDRLLDARDLDFAGEPPETLPDLEAYAEATGGALLELALQVTSGVGEPARQAAHLVGTAWALLGLMRAVPYHARQGRSYMPRSLVSGPLSVRRGEAMIATPELTTAVQEIGTRVRQRLDAAAPLIRATTRSQRAPFGLAILARPYLRDFGRAGWDPFVLARGRGRPLAAAHLALGNLLARY